jgi:hypothetical protein
LDLNFRKEQFSAAFVKALAAVAGLSVARPDPDCDSEDLILSARLVTARPVNLAVPRLLVVIEVPAGDNPEDWVHHSHDRLCLLHAAYWASLFGYRAVANRTTVNVTVRIPLEQRLTASTLSSIMIELGQGERL